jgi:hypothetical protein
MATNVARSGGEEESRKIMRLKWAMLIRLSLVLRQLFSLSRKVSLPQQVIWSLRQVSASSGHDRDKRLKILLNYVGRLLTILPNLKAIYEEAHMYLYSKPFICMDTYTLHSFLTTIGVRNRAKLRDIEVSEWGYSSAYKAVNFPAISLLADATKLERLGINVIQWGVSRSTLPSTLCYRARGTPDTEVPIQPAGHRDSTDSSSGRLSRHNSLSWPFQESTDTNFF